jgi:2-polyprenyl-3-methyl-5-hydroxy-6-metoxy-1,4-benzoquinol methylase
VLTQPAEKKKYFNRYWQTRDIPSADARSWERAEYLLSLMDTPESGEVLDVGCGRGEVMSQLARNGYNVAGCDLATDTIASLQSDGLNAFVFDIEGDELPQTYNAILCLEVLQQLFDPEAALRKFCRALNKNGHLIISVPNEFHLLSRLRLLFGKSHLGHFEESHIRLFSPRRARQLFERVGLQIEKVISVPVIPPRMKALNWLGKIPAAMFPGLFSLSQIYKLKSR